MAKVLTLFFSRHLLLANTSIACLLYGSGDYLEQKLEGENLDGARTARFASLGLLFGPWEHYWYRVLDSKLPGKAARVVVYKVLLDQFLMSPAEYAVFYVGELFLLKTFVCNSEEVPGILYPFDIQLQTIHLAFIE